MNKKLIPKYQSPWTPINYKPPKNSEEVRVINKQETHKPRSKEWNYHSKYNPIYTIGNTKEKVPEYKPEYSSTSEIQADGTLTPGNGFMSGTDPMGEFYVSGVALNPIFKGLGYLGKLGLNKLSSKLISKPIFNNSIATSTGNKLLTLEQIETAFLDAKQWHLNRINGANWMNRATLAGFNSEEANLLRSLLVDQLNRLKISSPPMLIENSTNNLTRLGSYWKIAKNGKLSQGIDINPSTSLNDLEYTLIHELGHGLSFGLDGAKNSSELNILLGKLFPLINRMVDYNMSLIPEITEKSVPEVGFSFRDSVLKNFGYYTRPTELQSRGYEALKLVDNLKSGKPFNESLGARIFRNLVGKQGLINFGTKALGITIPTVVGGNTIYNNYEK